MSEKQQLQSLIEELSQLLEQARKPFNPNQKELDKIQNFLHTGRDDISVKLVLACLGDTIITMRELLGNIEELQSKQRDKKNKNQEEANNFRKDFLEKLKNEQNNR
jgi:helix-turn-helix protein